MTPFPRASSASSLVMVSLSALSLLVAALGCGGSGGEEAAPSVEALEGLPTLSSTVLETMDPEVAEQLVAVRRETEARLAEAGAENPARGASVGRLGEHYHAYQLMDLASAAYELAQQWDQENPRWHYLAGLSAAEAGQMESARGAYGQALERLSDSSEASGAVEEWATVTLALARAERELGQEESARRRLEELVERAPGAVAARFELGQLLALAGESEAAAGHYEAVLRLAPQAQVVHLPLAQVYRELGREEAARAQLARRGPGRLAEVDPFLAPIQALATGAAAHLTRAGQAWRQGQLEAALGHYRQAVAAAPEHLGARRDFAFVLAEAGRAEEAAQQLRRALEVAPGDPLLHHGLGLMLARIGDLAGALEAQERAVERDPRFADAQFELGLVLARSGRPAPAVERFTAVLELDPQQHRARLNRATALLELGRPSQALEDYRSLRSGSLASRARLGEGQALVALGRWGEARRLLEGELLSSSGEGRSDDGGGESATIERALIRLLALAPTPEADAGQAAAEQANAQEALRLAQQAFEQESGASQARSLAFALAATAEFEAAVNLQRQLLSALSASLAPGDPVLEALEEEGREYESARPCCSTASPSELAQRIFSPL
ncbi:MAG: tetratricopeptide repeat protein [Acidobacteriota bacterium]